LGNGNNKWGNGMVKGIFTAIFEFITDKLNKRD